jgi:hypothetical protein
MELNKSYNRSDFIEIVQGLITGFARDVRKIEYSSSIVSEVWQIGVSTPLDLVILEVKTSRQIHNKVGITNEAFRILHKIGAFTALVSFSNVETISGQWRLSLVKSEPKIVDGKITTEFSNPKRLSYLLGKGAKIATPTKHLINRGKCNDFLDLCSRFSMEVVNKDFYESIALLFTELVGGKRDVGSKHLSFPGLLSINDEINQTITHQEFAVRLIGRLLFCWFLKEKKSLKGIPLISDGILSSFGVFSYESYYHSVLEPLFFEILNTRVEDRKQTFHQPPFSWTPYLNGGLFNPHETDHYEFDYVTQSGKIGRVDIPNDWFHRIFVVFETYNFTVDENTTFDVDLSIDPEMLGRIFENLLAEINPDTGESARKSTGSFYTPRNIVDFMVDNSLQIYLQNKTRISLDKLEKLTSINVEQSITTLFSSVELVSIIEALSSVKILDPACGSGAFPIGLMQKIVYILQLVDPDSRLWLDQQLKFASPELIRLFNEQYQKSNFNYLRKLGIIRECIFGVDIQPIATEISRLRCFLTLIVDEIVEDNSPNRGIETLPNLDFKFVSANSLVRLSAINEIFDNTDQIETLKKTRNSYFNATSDQRKRCQNDFLLLQSKMSALVTEQYGGTPSEKFLQLIRWNPFSDSKVDWLDTEWMFGVKCFDIVIENPPYVSTKDIGDKDKKLLEEQYGFVDDLYNHFIVRSIELLKPNGILTVISSDTYFTTETKKNLRTNILNHFIHKIAHLGYDVFDSAMVSTAVLIMQNQLKPNPSMQVIDSKRQKDFNLAKQYLLQQTKYQEAINQAFFVPNEVNLKIHNRLAGVSRSIERKYGEYIKTSKTIDKYKHVLQSYRNTLKQGDFTLIGLVTEGGQGLATANNGLYVGVLDGTKEADAIRQNRYLKMAEFNAVNKCNYAIPKDENRVWSLFDDIKEKYGRDVFGQGFIFRIVPKEFVVDTSNVKSKHQECGFPIEGPTFVPYDKGDKDGNRWFLENPYVIDWSETKVRTLQENSHKKGEGSSRFQNARFYFKEGFCYSDIKTHFIKARLKPVSIHDIKSMSLFSLDDRIPNAYLITLLNSNLIANIVDNFINNTQTFQINDCRAVPIPIPSDSQLRQVLDLFNNAVDIQKLFFASTINKDEKLSRLDSIQNKVDQLVEQIYGI